MHRNELSWPGLARPVFSTLEENGVILFGYNEYWASWLGGEVKIWRPIWKREKERKKGEGGR